MSWLLDLRLIRLFDFYLALIFLISCGLRIRQYRAILGLIGRFPGRWPNLLRIVREHWNIFLTWGTVLPLALVLGLLLANSLARHWLFPLADEFKVEDLLAAWPALPVVLLSGLAMLAFDIYGTWDVGMVDQTEMEKYFDQAEYWLKSWRAPVVRFVTLGYINPRQMVAVEVRAALVSASQLLNTTLWWLIIQTGLRILFGLSLWGSYAAHEWLRALVS